MPELEATLLGPVHFSFDGEPVRPGPAKERATLLYLAASGAPIARADLARLLWGPGRTRNVRQAVYGLRALAGAEHWLDDGDPIAVRASSDVLRLEAAVREGRWADAVALARGTVGEDVEIAGDLPFHEWLAEERSRVEALTVEALVGRGRALADEGDDDGAEALATRAEALEPLSEAVAALRIELALAAGHRDRARERLDTFRRRLAAELGIEPSAHLAGLLDTPPRRVAPSRDDALALGRADETRRMRLAVEAHRGMLLTGSSGVGKTHLAHAFARERGQALVVTARPTDGEPYAAYGRFLLELVDDALLEELPTWAISELSRICPAAFPSASRTSMSSSARASSALDLAYEKAARRVDTIVVDGLARMDADSRAAFLRMVARPPMDRRAALVLTVGAPLPQADQRTLTTCAADGLLEEIAVGGLSLRDTRRLLEAEGFEVTLAQARRVHAYSGGNPYLVRELTRAVDAEALDEPDALVPEAVQARFAARAEALGREARRALEVLAIAGSDAPTAVLASAAGADELDLMDALAEAESAGLLTEGWFDGELVRDATLAELAAERARSYHRRLAQAFEAHDEPRRAADHWIDAGEPARAAPRLIESAAQALGAGAFEEAEASYRGALEHADDAIDRVSAWVGLVDLARQRGDLDAEAEALAEADTDARRLQDDRAIFRVTIRQAEHALARRTMEQAALAADEAFDIADRLGDDAMRARALAARGTVRLRAGVIDGAERDFRIAADAADPLVRIGGQWGLGACAGCLARFEEATRWHREALTSARALGDVRWALRLLNGLAATGERAARYAESAHRFGQALELAEELGEAHTCASILLNLAEVTRKCGQLGPSEAALERAMPLVLRVQSPRLSLVASIRTASLHSAVGAYDAARAAWDDAVARAEAVGDARNLAIALFNRSLVDVEAEGTHEDEALERALALRSLAEEVARWALAELAIYSSDPDITRRAAEAITEPIEHAHLRYLVAAARGAPCEPDADYLEAAWLHGTPVNLDGLSEPRAASWRARLARLG